MTTRKLTTQPPTPQPGDLYVQVDGQGKWIQKLTLTRYKPGKQPLGDFDGEDGRSYEFPFDPKIVRPCKLTKPQDDRDPVEVAERRRYNQRSRTTAPQRARAKITDKQRRFIFWLGGQRGMHKEQIEDLAPGGDLKKLSIGEANQIIARLQGNKRAQGGPCCKRGVPAKTNGNR